MTDDQGKGQEETMTEHGRWTPEVSRAADRELRELARESPEADLGPATESVDKSDLSLPTERHGGDH